MKDDANKPNKRREFLINVFAPAWIALTVLSAIVLGIMLISKCAVKMDKDALRDREAANKAAFENPEYVDTLPNGQRLYKIYIQHGTGGDTIYFYDNDDGERVISTNYGDKMRRNSPTITIENN